MTVDPSFIQWLVGGVAIMVASHFRLEARIVSRLHENELKINENELEIKKLANDLQNAEKEIAYLKEKIA